MSANLPSFQITARRNPSQGSRAIQLYFDLTAATNIAGDLLLEIEGGHIDFLQSIKIDNSDNASQFIMEFPGIGSHGDRVVVPPNTMGTYPIFVTPGRLQYIARSVGGVAVLVTLFNIELPYVNWATIAPPAPLPTSVVTGIETDHSGVIAAANVSQVAIPANALALRRVIQNPSANIGSLWINTTGAATEDKFSQELLPGQEFDTAFGPLTTAAINIISATLAATYMAKEIHS